MHPYLVLCLSGLKPFANLYHFLIFTVIFGLTSYLHTDTMMTHTIEVGSMKMNNCTNNFHSCTVHLDIIKVFLFTNGCTIYLFSSTLKFTTRIAPTYFGLTTILREHLIDLS